jgi:hypothetical protein
MSLKEKSLLRWGPLNVSPYLNRAFSGKSLLEEVVFKDFHTEMETFKGKSLFE